jgi:hypothetical protein
MTLQTAHKAIPTYTPRHHFERGTPGSRNFRRIWDLRSRENRIQLTRGSPRVAPRWTRADLPDLARRAAIYTEAANTERAYLRLMLRQGNALGARIARERILQHEAAASYYSTLIRAVEQHARPASRSGDGEGAPATP